MKRTAGIIIAIIIVIAFYGYYNNHKYSNDSDNYSYSYSNDNDYYTKDSYFTNDYGTSNTTCAHSGCTNKIASSGDTNCCTLHSRKCLNCGCYIDEDAMYCLDCIKSTLK